MFRSAITQTPFISDEANDYFDRINGEAYGDDWTFLSTLRALVAPRLPETDKIKLKFSQSDYDESSLNSNSHTAVLKSVCYDITDCCGLIVIHDFFGSTSDACMQIVEDTFEKIYNGWHRLNKVTNFFRSAFRVVCFINPEQKSVYIFTEKMNMRSMHYLQAAIVAFIPWYFPKEDGLSSLEMELIKSCTEKTSDKYAKCIASIASQYDFRTPRIRKLLAKIETYYERQACEDAKNEIQQCNRELNALNVKIGQWLRAKADHEIRLLGLEAKIAQEQSSDSEIMEYFLCNKQLVLNSVQGTYITFSCMDYLTYFDENMAEKMIDNNSSYLYTSDSRSYGYYVSRQNMKRLMHAIFIDQILRVKMCAAYRLDLRGNIASLSHFQYGYEFSECTPNPHIDQYSCMGNHECVVNEMLQDHNYIGAIEQCLASCKSLNFGDSYVMSVLMERFYSSNPDVNIRCIELPDGRVVRPRDAVQWLDEQEPTASTEQDSSQEMTEVGSNE